MKFVKVPQSSSDYRFAILASFDHVVHWHANLFLLPHGNLADQFIASLTELFRDRILPGRFHSDHCHVATSINLTKTL